MRPAGRFQFIYIQTLTHSLIIIRAKRDSFIFEITSRSSRFEADTDDDELKKESGLEMRKESSGERKDSTKTFP